MKFPIYLHTLLFRITPLLVITLPIYSVQAGNIIHVPMSWCVVEGSPAEANPNIAGDTETDAVIWRRHERPTDNIFLPQTEISLRSSINNAWSSLDFPIIADPDTTLGVQGDMRGEDVNAFGAEFNALLNACDTAYDNIGRAGIGITAVNANLFHNASGSYVGTIGWAGCNEFPAGTCVSPYDGRVVVIDNAYMHPGSPDRTFPGSSNQFTNTDSLDILTAHEVGHALSLNHRTPSTAMMFSSISDNNSDGDADNIDINATERASLRANALNVPGMELDPPGVFFPGEWLQMRIPDPIKDQNSKLPFMDIASARIVQNRQSHETHFELQLASHLPPFLPDPPCEIVILVDTDTNSQTGATPETFKKLGIPTTFKGSDVILHAKLQSVAGAEGPVLIQQSWMFQEETGLVSLDSFRTQLREMAVYPQFADMLKPPNDRKIDARFVAHHSIAFVGQLPEALPIKNSGRISALILQRGEIIDELDLTENEDKFVLEDPKFPHCFPAQEEVKQGESILVNVDGLIPNAKIHGLLGADEVLTGVADASGGGTFKMPVPVNATPGPHLATFGVIGTALTADCTIIVTDKNDCAGDLDKDGDVDNLDARLFSRDFATPSCRAR